MASWLDAGRRWLTRARAGAGAITLEVPAARPGDRRPGRAPRPPLPDAGRVLGRLVERLQSDPLGVIREISDLRARWTLDGRFLETLARAHARTGDDAGAVAAARAAIPCLLKQREGLRAARLLDELNADAAALGLDRTVRLALGGALGKTGSWPIAVKALASLVMENPGDRRAVEELARIAEHLAAGGSMPAEAWKIYRFLEVVAVDPARRSEFARRAEQAERQIAPGRPRIA